MGLTPLVIVGAGGHGREVLDVVEACVVAGAPFRFAGFLDDGEPDPAPLAARGARLLGPVVTVATRDDAAELVAVFGIGAAGVRSRVAAASGLRAAPPLIHPSASVGSEVALGPGSVLAAGARVTTNVVAGAHVHLGANVVIGHDCELGDFATIYPGAVVSGNVRVGVGVTIGAGAAVRQGTILGEGCFIGMGAVVLDDVAAGATVAGVPARPLKPEPPPRAAAQDGG